MELEIPIYVSGEEIYEGSGLKQEEIVYSQEDNFWADELLGEDLALSVTKVQPGEEGEERIEEIYEEILQGSGGQKINFRDGVKAVEGIGEEFTEGGKYQEEAAVMSRALPVIYNRAPEVVNLEVDAFRNFLMHLGDEADAIEDKEGYEMGDRESVGSVFHNLAGNTPLVDVSLMSSKAWGNADIAKTASGDPLTPYLLASVIGQEDEGLGNSTAVINFDSTVGGELNSLYDEIVNRADVLDAYGGFQALRSMRGLGKRHNVELVDHGPKRALECIAEGNKNLAEEAAFDTVPFNQEACTAPAVVFYEGQKDKKFSKEEVAESFQEITEEFRPTANANAFSKKDQYFTQRNFESDGEIEIITPQKLKKEQGLLLDERNEEEWWRVIHYDEDAELKPQDFEHADKRVLIVKSSDTEEVENWIEKYEINGVPMKNYISRFGISGNEEMEKYVKEEMPLTTLTEPGNVSLPSEVGVKHDGVYDLIEFSS